MSTSFRPPPGGHATGNDVVPAVLDELRLDPAWPGVRAAAVSQALARLLAERTGVSFDSETLSRFSAQIFADRGVGSQEDLDLWMRQRRLDEVRVRALVESEARRRWGEDVIGAAMSGDLIEQLQLSAEYPRLLARALDKQARLSERGLLGLRNPVDCTNQELLTWWSRQRPHLAPSQLAEDAERDGFATVAELRQAMVDEYHYVTRCGTRTGELAVPGGMSDADLITVVDVAADPDPAEVNLLGDLDEFGCQYWDRAPLVRRGDAAFDAESILGFQDLDRLLASRRTPVRLLDRGVYVGDPAHHAVGRAPEQRHAALRDPADALREFRHGRTIVVPSVQDLWAPIDRVASRLECRLGAPIDATLFVSPGGAVTDWHADKTHGIVLQLHGTKRWSVERDGRTGVMQVNAPLDVALAPGDVLYVPLGFLHQVRALEGVSAHITFSAAAASWLDRAKAAISARCETQSLAFVHRTPVNPKWGAGAAERSNAESQRVMTELRSVVHALDAAALSSGGSTPRVRSRASRGSFLQACQAMSVTPNSTVHIQHGVKVRLEEGPAWAQVRFDDRRIQFPRWLTPTVAALLGNGTDPVALTALPGQASDTAVLIRRLVAEGMVVLGTARGPER